MWTGGGDRDLKLHVLYFQYNKGVSKYPNLERRPRIGYESSELELEETDGGDGGL